MKDIYTLHDAIQQGATLTADEKDGLFKLLGTGCRVVTKERLLRRLEVPLVMWPNYGLYRRLYLRYNNEGVHYCAGQDYTSELRFVRELVLKG